MIIINIINILYFKHTGDFPVNRYLASVSYANSNSRQVDTQVSKQYKHSLGNNKETSQVGVTNTDIVQIDSAVDTMDVCFLLIGEYYCSGTKEK